jgi:hypothetical protein
MIYAVGGLLLLVFVLFAALMFLERISALLALPLMALAFLLVAVSADLLQSATTTELVQVADASVAGGQRLEEREVSARFAQWQAFCQAVAESEHERVTVLADALNNVSASLGADDVLTALHSSVAVLSDAERQHQAAAVARLQDYPDFFASSHTISARTRALRELDTLKLSDRLQPAVAAFLQSNQSTAARAKLAADLKQLERVVTDWQADHPAPAAERSTLADAAAYVFGYIVYVTRAGSLMLYAAIIATVFGGMFAVYVKNLKIAERLVYWTAEFAGERPFVIALAVFLVTAGIFTSVGGLGTVIMIGTIILPILRSVGLSPVVGAGIFLIALSMGGTLDPVSRRLWIELFGIPEDRLNTMLWTMVALYFTVGVGWIWWGTRRGLLSSFSSEPADDARRKSAVSARLMIAPIIPVALVYFGGVDEITTFLIALVYMFLCVATRPGSVRVFARSLIEGAQVVMPPVLLMFGIGMLLVSLQTEPVQSYLRPLLAAAVPEARWGYIVIFGLAAPLALYRGPLNRWGMGLAIASILLTMSSLSPPAILGAILAAGMVQGICDPTNTYNVWIAGFQGITVNQILRYTLLPVWAAAAIAIAIFGLRFVSG